MQIVLNLQYVSGDFDSDDYFIMSFVESESYEYYNFMCKFNKSKLTKDLNQLPCTTELSSPSSPLNLYPLLNKVMPSAGKFYSITFSTQGKIITSISAGFCPDKSLTFKVKNLKFDRRKSCVKDSAFQYSEIYSDDIVNVKPEVDEGDVFSKEYNITLKLLWEVVEW